VTDAELACLAVAHVLLRYDDERHWLPAAPGANRAPVPEVLGQSEYSQRARAAGPLLEAALRWLADHTRPVPSWCGCWMPPRSPVASPRPPSAAPGLFGYAGYGYCLSHFRWYWAMQADDDLHLRWDGDRIRPGQPETVWRAAPADAQRSARQPPVPGTSVTTDKGLAGEGTEEFSARPAWAWT
jgi:hypothetical protein